MTHPYEYILERKPWRRRISRHRDIEYLLYSHIQSINPFGSFHYITNWAYDHRPLSGWRKRWNNERMYLRFKGYWEKKR